MDQGALVQDAAQRGIQIDHLVGVVLVGDVAYLGLGADRR